MKCRDGCENKKPPMHCVCDACWLRVPRTLRWAWWFIESLEDSEKAERDIRDWLAADDKRRG